MEITDIASAEALTSHEIDSNISYWNGHSLSTSTPDQANRLGNALEKIRFQMAQQGPEQLEKFDNCLITFLVWEPNPCAPLSTRVENLKKLMINSQFDPQLVKLLEV
ncbi:MAG: hypothetical protein JSR58_07725 [Verrucomicrobia bacterium]|nr:hypothetical protein [Verrucomicrobiota bacterium]